MAGKYFAVEVCDDHDGGSVWYVDEDYIQDRTEADELAAKKSKTRENKVARVLAVNSRVEMSFFDGEPVAVKGSGSVCPVCRNQARPLPCPECGPSHEARRAAMMQRLMAYGLRGLAASGLVPEDEGRLRWNELPVETQRAWKHLAAQVLYQVESLRRAEDAPREPEGFSMPVFFWRGEAQELAEQIARTLDVEQLAALSGEVALAWRQKYHALRSTETGDGGVDG